MVLRGRFRQYWKSWLALSGLVALAGGFAVTAVTAAFPVALGCASCRKPIDLENTLINEVPPGQLPRLVMLLSGRMPHPSDPREVLASFTLAQDNGVRVGSVIRAQLASLAQLNGGPADPSPVLRPALRVVGIVAAEREFPSGAAVHYDLYATAKFAAAVNQRAAVQHTYYARFAHGAADLASL